LNQENQFGPWFTLSDKERQQLGSPMGPQNPQALNRYSYVLNNPVRYTDPSGHALGRDSGISYQQLLSYSTVTVSLVQAQRGYTAVDSAGNTIHADPETGVLYRVDQFGNKQRLYQIASVGAGCGNTRCQLKYVYEDDPNFIVFKGNIDVSNTTSLPIDGVDVFMASLGCLGIIAATKEAVGCGAGAVVSLTLSGVAGVNRSVQTRVGGNVAAHDAFDSATDSGRPKERQGPPIPK
jgi:hypothetical protein